MDDVNGAVPATFHAVELANIVWQIPERYNEQLQYIGSGSYGSVVSAFDRLTGTQVAIKKVACQYYSEAELRDLVSRDMGENKEENAGGILTQRVYRELRLLRHMNHTNVLGLLDVYTPQADATSMQEVYFVTKFMDANLASVSGLLKFNAGRVQSIMYQLLCGLQYIHSAGVIHRDLKPVNVAVTKEWDLRILDFGLARQARDIMTGYISSLWYRAPEMMLNFQRYSQAADMWSVGCIMGELISGTALFPARSGLGHLALIVDLIGSPSEQLRQGFDHEGFQYFGAQPLKPPKDFSEKFRHASPSAVDLLKQLLEWDPKLRITAKNALAHPYLAAYRDPANETSAAFFSDTVVDLKLSAERWRCGILEEIQLFQAEQQRH